MKTAPGRSQRGVTLIELLVAMTVGMVITIAALSMLILGRSGHNAVDSSSQLVDRERFAIDIISRVVAQAGYQDFAGAVHLTRSIAKTLGQDPEPDLFGWNDAYFTAPDDLFISTTSKIADANRAGKCGTITDTSCLNGSDILVVRFQGAGPTSSPDGTMINCRGLSEPGLFGADLNERAASVFYIQRPSTGSTEPSLYCSYYNHATGGWVGGQPLLEGVESMQLLFGTDNVSPGIVPAAGGQDSVVDRWLRADQLKVPSNPTATRENWRRVRAVRVGLVLRGPVGSAQERVAESLYPLGTPTFVASADSGSKLDVPADGRLRRVVNFTVHIRNDLSTR